VVVSAHRTYCQAAVEAALGRLLEHYVDPWAFLQRQAQAGRIQYPKRWEGRYANVA
jgi:hypothetical protein